MQGLVVIGTSGGVAEREVADAVGATTFVVSEGRAAPLIAARLAGSRLDPEALLEEARRTGENGDMLLVATSGGLMAPITERYTNRDLAHELGLPVVLVAPAEAGLTANALLALDSALGNGLAVAGIVIAGWPDPPDRVLLEERALLERMARVPVVVGSAPLE